MAPVSDPLLDQARRILAGFGGMAWVGGGWAIDLFVGAVSRRHQDVDIVVPVADLETFVAHVGGSASVRDGRTGAVTPLHPGGAASLRPGPDVLTFEALPFAHEMLPAKVEGDEWVFPRGSGRIRRSLGAVGFVEPGGLLVQRPEVVLVHKSRSPRPVDHQDFQTVLPHLSAQQRAWLAGSIAPRVPDHAWLPALTDRS